MTEQRPQAFDQLKEQLKEMFQLDRGDLDFGIYRIMNQKRDEVTKFLEKQLLPQVQSILKNYEPSGMLEKKKELQEAEANPNKYSTAYIEDLQKAVNESVDVSKLEQEIYSDLHNFFKRYYSEGDFMSLRRYKEGVYALPYEGEEVKLHWANHDQYYIKTSENLKNYSFKTPLGKRVRFEVVAGGTETNNNKAAEGKERHFLLHKKEPLVATADELTIRFEYRPDDTKQKQDKINEKTLEDLFNLAEVTNFGLNQESSTEKNAKRTLLEKHLTDFTAKNTFDYFIHKDLGHFLSRELDFYIKNEIMHLDDIENETTPRVEAYLAKVKAMRKVAGKIIQFLAQLEDFQKKLWLKKKFVLETHYCVTLDHIIGSEAEEELLSVIATNSEQRTEWVQLFTIDDRPDYSTPLSVSFLKNNDKLLVDTKFFDITFKYRLLSLFDDLDEQIDGVLVNSENFQALNLLQGRYSRKIDMIYIDPPYNTDATPILYKNGFKSSTWLSMMENRLKLGFSLLRPIPYSGYCTIAIDDHELANLCVLHNKLFPRRDLHRVIVNHYPGSGTGRSNVSRTHEYALFSTDYGCDILRGDAKPSGVRKRGFCRSGNGENNYRTGRPNSFYAVLVNEDTLNIMGFEPPPPKDLTNYPTSKNDDGYARIYPLGQDGTERCWSLGYESANKFLAEGMLECTPNLVIKRKYYDEENRHLLPSLWVDKKYSAVSHGTNLLTSLFGKSGLFSYPKSLFTVKSAIEAGNYSKKQAIIIDYFAGSGTTGHAVINLNREDGGRRKYILVEMGEYFNSVTKPRIQKAAYARKWINGKPQELTNLLHELKKALADKEKEIKNLKDIEDRSEYEYKKQLLNSEREEIQSQIDEINQLINEGADDFGSSSQCFKYMALEQYEDTLDNLRLNTTATLLTSNPALNEQYTLGYMLDVESRGSQSLLNIDAFVDPFAYKLEITRNDDTQKVNVDLVETFNYLLGLTIRTVTRDKCGIVTITGTNSLGENCLIIWRNADEIDNNNLDTWFEERRSSEDFDFDAIYVNGDSNIENMKPADEHWHVRLIEAEFKNLMFDTKDV